MSDFRVRMGIGLEWSPWRVPAKNFKWSKDTADSLRKDILKTLPTDKTTKEYGISQLRVLFLGPAGHGKSSLINSFASISLEDKTSLCNAGGGNAHVTTTYRSYEFTGELKQVRPSDVTGLPKEQEEKIRPFLEDLKLLMHGHIASGFKFDLTKTISEEDSRYVASPTLSDKIHCAIIVFSCEEAYEIHQHYIDSLMALLKTINDLNVPVMVVLTKADKLSSHVKYDVQSLFRCRLIRDAVNKIAEQLTIPPAKIFPVVNFEERDVYSWQEAIPLLLALRSCLLVATTHAHNIDKPLCLTDK